MTKMLIDVNWSIAMPITIVVVAALVGMLVDAYSSRKEYVAWVSVAGLALAFVYCVRLWGNNLPATFGILDPNTGQAVTGSGQLIADNYALFLNMLFLGVGLATVFISLSYLDRQKLLHGEYFILLLFAISGMMLMVQATELITIFVALEALSISLYVLSAFARSRKRSAEAGLKYLLLGAFSSAFFLYGIALIYGSTGTTNLQMIFDWLGLQGGTTGGAAQYMLPAGIGLLIVGFGFKVAAVPFHIWTPDVYEGAPTPITAFMSVTTKAAAFGALARILLFAFPAARGTWEPIIVAMSIATMVVGNFVAVLQSNMKRMLAYSSIAHAGYVLIGLVGVNAATGQVGDTTGILFYLFSYALMNFGAFAGVAYLTRTGQEYTNVDDFRGLAFRNLPVAIAMSVFMFSLAGIPPAIGYYGKFVLFTNAVTRGYTGLVVFAVLASAVSAYYYLRVVVVMWMREAEPQVRPMRLAPGLALVLTVCAAATVICGIFLNPFIKAAENAAPMQAPGVAKAGTPPTTVARSR